MINCPILMRRGLVPLLLALLVAVLVPFVPGAAQPAHASSLAATFMLPDAACSAALSSGMLALGTGSQFPLGTGSVCLTVLTDAGPADAVGLTISTSAGAVVYQSALGSTATGRLDFGGGIANLIFSGLQYQNMNGSTWPDGSYRTDVILNGAAGASANWTVGTGALPLATPTSPPSLDTATPLPPTATLAVPTATAAATATATEVPPTHTPIPPTSTSLPPTSTLFPPTVTAIPATATPIPATNTPIPPKVGSDHRPLTDPKALQPAQQQSALGTVAPGFSLATVDGHRYRLASLHGHTVILEFFAIWCSHCQREAPILNRLQMRYGPRGLRVLSILAHFYGKDYESTGDSRLAARGDIDWFTKTFHVNHPILIDPRFATVNRYGVYSYSTIFVLDSKGVIRFIHTGETSYSTLAAVFAVKMHRASGGADR